MTRRWRREVKPGAEATFIAPVKNSKSYSWENYHSRKITAKLFIFGDFILIFALVFTMSFNMVEFMKKRFMLVIQTIACRQGTLS